MTDLKADDPGSPDKPLPERVYLPLASKHPEPAESRRWAILSACGRYRYALGRRWQVGGSTALYCMLNPSTADGEMDDPTIRSCVRLAKHLGHGAVEVVNLFAWRATQPDDLLKVGGIERVGGRPQEYAVNDAIKRAAVVICGWGAHKVAAGRGGFFVDRCRALGHTPQCFGRTKSGEPRHPLYVATATPLEPYR